MKKTIVMCLILAMALSAGSALANTNVLRTDNSFSMNFTDLDGAEMHVMALQAGDELYISTVITGGALSLMIRQDGGEIIYLSSESPEPGFTVQIPLDGLYRFTVTGEHASGSVWISMKTLEDLAPGGIPFQRERVQSDLGYTAEYDPFLFEYAHSEGEDLFAVRSQMPEGVLDLSMSVSVHEGTLFEVAEALLADEQVTELMPSVVDWRAARNFRQQPETAYGSPIRDYILIEMNDASVLYIVKTYFVGVEDAAQRMQNIIDSMQFTY